MKLRNMFTGSTITNEGHISRVIVLIKTMTIKELKIMIKDTFHLTKYDVVFCDQWTIRYVREMHICGLLNILKCLETFIIDVSKVKQKISQVPNAEFKIVVWIVQIVVQMFKTLFNCLTCLINS